MRWFGRFLNLFRKQRIDEDWAEEMASHLAEAEERGRSVDEARQAFGNALQHRERSRDIRLLGWLDALASDAVFGWRQLRKRPAVSVAAILSLALAIGATTAAFQLIHAVLLRTMPVADPQSLYYVASTYIDREGKADYRDEFDYPTFVSYREAAADRAELLVAGMTARQEAVLTPGAEPERVYRQFVSGNLFGVFGLQPALGRLIGPNDDLKPGGHPVAVVSHEFWMRRFGGDAEVVGRTFRMAGTMWEVIGVGPKGFVGSEPGAMTDVFVPAVMNVEALNSPGWSWFRLWVRPKPGVSAEQARLIMQAVFRRRHEEGLKNFAADTPKAVVDRYMAEELVMLPAQSGVSDVQRQYRRPLWILSMLVGLVLLIACTNTGNLLTAQAAARTREMALRVSIGAGRWRLVQLVMVESLLLAGLATALGTLFAAWSAPVVVAMLQVPQNPVRLPLGADWEDWGFSVALTFFVAILFGLAPALRASGVKPMSALRGGAESHSRRRTMHVLLAMQMAFCVLVQFIAGLFVSTFDRLSNRPLGFTVERLLVADVQARKAEPRQSWEQVVDHLRGTPGVQGVAMASWPPLSGNRWTLTVRVPGIAPEARAPYALGVTPSYFDTMRIEMLGGRDFHATDVPPRLDEAKRPLPGKVIVNDAFAQIYFHGENPVGRVIAVRLSKDQASDAEIVGYVRNATYSDIREPMRPMVYLPMEDRGHVSFFVRMAGEPAGAMQLLRRTVGDVRSDLRVVQVQEQSAFVRWQVLRERLLATLSLFFAIVALALAGIGLYGVLNYAVTRQTKEIGIRTALGARPLVVMREVASGPLAMVALGLAIGLGGGVACGRMVESMLYEVKATDPSAVLGPVVVLVLVAVAAALPPALRAARIDPVDSLRAE
ncbi:MAG: ABC transporter permease [Acidobacteria bacterium]|nr:ABC transporter permease [Acidobacteriota bacterium]